MTNTAPSEFIHEYEAALASQSWPLVAPLIHERCVVTFSDGTYSGKSEVETAFRKTFSLIKDEKYEMNDLHWVYAGETFAVLTCAFAWTGLVDGRPASGSGRGTLVLTLENGRWQLLCEHLGPPAP